MNRLRLEGFLLLLAFLALVFFLCAAPAHETTGSAEDGQYYLPLVLRPALPRTVRVSVPYDTIECDGYSYYPGISDDGRIIAYSSSCDRLVPDDMNGVTDIFVYERETGETTRVSVASDGTESNDRSWLRSTFDGGSTVSADGRFIAFLSDASNLAPGDTNEQVDVFVHDRTTGETTRVSLSSDGAEGNGECHNPSVSADGRFVAFDSSSSNLVSADLNDEWDVFVHDRQTGETKLVSVNRDGTPGDFGSFEPSISGDGRFVAFLSRASNLTGGTTDEGGIFVRDRARGETTWIAPECVTEGELGSHQPSISTDGRFVAFTSECSRIVPDDTNDRPDIFVYDRRTGETTRISVSSDGAESNDYSWAPAISAEGRYIAFSSLASNLVPGDANPTWDSFLHDRETGETILVSVGSDGTQGNGESYLASVSADGRFVVFQSYATNLVGDDSNLAPDIYLRDRGVAGFLFRSQPN